MSFLRKIYLQQKSDIELMGLIKAKADRDAFALIYERYSAGLYSFVRNYVGNENVAEEIAHEAFLKLFEKREHYKEGHKVQSWLWTIARNMCLDWFRKRKEYLVSNEEDEKSLEEMAISEEEGTLEKLILNSEVSLLREAIEALKVSQKEAILLWIDDMKTDDIADVIGKSTQATKNLIHRAKLTLKEKLKEQIEEA